MERYKKLDVIRGITIISMILYHGIWDITSLFQYDIPWSFLYVTGFYIHKLSKNKKELLVGKEKGWRVTSWIGKHSLLIYMLHQPLIYGIMEAIL